MKLSKAIILVAVATLTFTSQCFSDAGTFRTIKASKVLPNQGKNNYKTSNMTDLNPNTIWAASFDGKPIYLYLDYGEKFDEWPIYEINIRNGYHRDQKSLINNSRVKDVKIYVNSLDNLWTEATLPDVKKLPNYTFDTEPEYDIFCDPKSKKFNGFNEVNARALCDSDTYQSISLPYDSPVVKGKFIKTIIIEIVSIYPGNKWNDVCISDIAYEGKSSN